MGRTLLALVNTLTAATLIALGDHSPRIASGDESPPPSTATDDKAIIRTLLEQTAAQREEIFSANIRYRWHLATYRRGENTPDRVHALLEEHDLVADPDSLRDLVNALVPEPATIDPPWEMRTFQMLGEKRRADTSQDVIQLVDGTHEMEYEGSNEQLTIGDRGYSDVHLTDVTDFRSYLPSPPGGLKVEDFCVAERGGNQVTLETILPPDAPVGTVPGRYTFDLSTGIMTRSTRYIGNRISREVWQLALTEYPGGIVMPAVRIDTRYRGGRLKSLRVFLIEEAEFNGPVSENQFVMPVAAGTVLVDYRHPKKTVWRTETAADDVRSLLVPVSSPVPAVASGGGLSWQMVLILNGIALIVVATVLWRRASPSQVPPANSHKTDSS